MSTLGTWIMTATNKKQLQDTEETIHLTSKTKTWIHIIPKNEEELSKLLKEFDIHPLTIEDCMNPQNRIKMEMFPNYTLVVFRGLHFDLNKITAKNFNFIVTKNVLITIALDHRNTISDLILDWHKNRHLLQKGLEFVIHKIIDVETDHILPIVYRIEDQAEDLQSQIFETKRNLDINLIFQMRGNLQQIKKIINLHIEILKEMETSDKDFITIESDAFFRDVKDHSMRILEITETVKELISSALEVHLTISSRRSNEIMKMLTMITSVLLPMSLIAGLYGMNFHHMPFLDNRYGFWGSIIVMLSSAILMLGYFRIKDWI